VNIAKLWVNGAAQSPDRWRSDRSAAWSSWVRQRTDPGTHRRSQLPK